MDLAELELKRRQICNGCRASCSLWLLPQLEIVQHLQDPLWLCPLYKFEGEAKP
jgi:hypothetical protein